MYYLNGAKKLSGKYLFFGNLTLRSLELRFLGFAPSIHLLPIQIWIELFII